MPVACMISATRLWRRASPACASALITTPGRGRSDDPHLNMHLPCMLIFRALEVHAHCAAWGICMRLTLRTDYALRALIYLGARTGRLCTIQEIAAAFALPKTHVMKVINELARRGYVQTLRGKHGGVRLDIAAASIRVGA